MIELIFVIVIIGILSAVAIPRLIGQGDETKAAICAGEIENLVTELATNYSKEGYTDFQTLTVGKVTNLQTGVSDGDSISGIDAASTATLATALAAPLVYYCEGKEAAQISATTLSGKDYNLTVTAKSAAENPAAFAAAAIIAKNYKTTVGTAANVPLSY